MRKRWGVAAGFAAMAQLLLAGAARADSLLAQANWPPPRLAEPMQPVAGPRVTLQTDNPNARLQQYTPLRWRDVCLAPCGVTVDPAATYRIGGGTSMASDPFTLPRAAGEVHIDAEVGSKVKHWAGLGVMIGGGVAALYGLFWWQVLGGFADSANTSSSEDFGNTARNIGLVFIGIGAVLAIVGTVMFTGGTSVKVR
jgi:hypothetical protein